MYALHVYWLLFKHQRFVDKYIHFWKKKEIQLNIADVWNNEMHLIEL